MNGGRSRSQSRSVGPCWAALACRRGAPGGDTCRCCGTRVEGGHGPLTTVAGRRKQRRAERPALLAAQGQGEAFGSGAGAQSRGGGETDGGVS